MTAYIFSTGASGTHFLASIIDSYTDHEAFHEPRRFTLPLPTPTVVINGFLRELYPTLEGTHGVILRDPRQVMLSFFNRRKGKLDPGYPAHLQGVLTTVDQWVETGCHKIYFKEMVSERGRLMQWLYHLGVGITKPIPKEIMATKVNHNGRGYAASYEDLPEGLRADLELKCGWYIEKYFGD